MERECADPGPLGSAGFAMTTFFAEACSNVDSLSSVGRAVLLLVVAISLAFIYVAPRSRGRYVEFVAKEHFWGTRVYVVRCVLDWCVLLHQLPGRTPVKGALDCT